MKEPKLFSDEELCKLMGITHGEVEELTKAGVLIAIPKNERSMDIAKEEIERVTREFINEIKGVNDSTPCPFCCSTR